MTEFNFYFAGHQGGRVPKVYDSARLQYSKILAMRKKLFRPTYHCKERGKIYRKNNG